MPNSNGTRMPPALADQIMQWLNEQNPNVSRSRYYFDATDDRGRRFSFVIQLYPPGARDTSHEAWHAGYDLLPVAPVDLPATPMQISPTVRRHTQPNQNSDAEQYDVTVPVVISGLEIASNLSREQRFDLIESRIRQAEARICEELAAVVWEQPQRPQSASASMSQAFQAAQGRLSNAISRENSFLRYFQERGNRGPGSSDPE